MPMPPDSEKDDRPGSTAEGQASASARPGVRRMSSSELFGAASELVIVHGQREYRLRVTSNGKLILTA